MELQNLQPEIDRATTAAQILLQTAERSIRTAVEYGDAAELLKSVKAKYLALDREEHAITDPQMASLNGVRALFRGPKNILVEAERAIKARMGYYAEEQQRQAREAQRVADEAAAKERARLAALAEKATARGAEAKAEQFKDRAEMVVASVVVAEKPKVEGVALRTTYDFEIADPAALPREYLIPDEKRIRQVVKAMGKDANIPGVRVIERTTVVARVA